MKYYHELHEILGEILKEMLGRSPGEIRRGNPGEIPEYLAEFIEGESQGQKNPHSSPLKNLKREQHP